MAIKFTPGTPESKTFELLTKGPHSFTVVEAKQDTSKEGKDMVSVRLKHEAGASVWDYLVLTPAAIWKFHQFVKAVGQDPNGGEFDEVECIGATVEARVGIDPPKNGYDAKNKIEGYIFDDKEGF